MSNDERAALAASGGSTETRTAAVPRVEVERVLEILGLVRPGRTVPWDVVHGLLVMALRDRLVAVEGDRLVVTEFPDAWYFLRDWAYGDDESAPGASTECS